MMDKATKTFQALAKVPSLVSATVLEKIITDNNNNKVVVSSVWSQVCHERNKTICYSLQQVIGPQTRHITSFLPNECTSEIMSRVSPSGKYRAVLKEVFTGTSDSKKTQHLEIWGNSSRISATDLSALDVHGDVYSDHEFKCFEWSPSEESILYVAETKLPKSEPFYKRLPQETSSGKSGSGDKKVTKGEEYVYKEDWGEALVGKHRPALAVFNVKSENGLVVDMLEGIPKNFSPGQAIWARDGSIVGIVWEHEPRRLGLYACTNRASYVFHLAKGIFTLISGEGRAVRSPRFTPDGEYLVWLEREVGGPHNGAQRLMRCNWSTDKQVVVVLDTVADRLDGVDHLQFRGIFCSAIPTRSWANDQRRLLMNTLGPTTITSFLINIESGEVTILNTGTDYSLMVLDVADDFILCSKSSPKHPKTLVMGVLPVGEWSEIDWINLSEWRPLPGLEDVEYGVHYTSASYDYGFSDLNAIYLKPPVPEGSTVPVIIWPHGGPHGNFVNSFNNTAAVFVLLGFGVVMVNYRGSTGMGQNCVNFLLGKCGNADVKDCQQVAEEVCNLAKLKFDGKRKILFGGSHGGFLSAHLIGQYPLEYLVAVIKNPVIDIPSKVFASDHPGTCATCTGGTAYSFKEDTSKEDFMKMYDASPIRYASKVKTPTLLLIGRKDVRVPCSQGLQYYQKLKANGVKTKLLIYEDNHSLSQISVDMDAVLNSIMWFYEHLGMSTDDRS